jgi:transposase
MSKARVVVLEVTSGHLSVTAAARAYGLSRQHIYRLLSRYRDGGLDAVEPRSRRPASNPHTVGDEVIAAVVLLREHLTADGLDAGPLTLQGHLAHQGLPVPSTSTIRRILHHHGLITPQPRKRPRSSYRRFQAEQPNAGNPTSPTGPCSMAPTSKSSTGSTTTPATCCHAPPTDASPDPTSSPHSPPPPPNSAYPPPH